MITTFTSNDVLRYFYGETLKSEKNAIEEELAFNTELQDVYCEIEASDRILKNTQVSPDKNVIDNILLYSKTLASVH